MPTRPDTEIERRFLVHKVPADLTLGEGRLVADRYIPADAGHCYLRVRQDGDELQITKKVLKRDGDHSQMLEYTIPLSKAEYEALCTVPSKDVIKRRYDHKIAQGTLQIGVFAQALSGLIIADVEFDSHEASELFVTPHWVAADVTGDKRFAGGELCGKSIGDLAAALAEYGITVAHRGA